MKTTLLLILTIGILISTSISVIKIPEKEIIETPDIKTFKSLEELRSYIESSRTSYIYHPLLETTMAPMFAVEEQARKYSTTNIQVTGVDEADIIKTDGKYIYIASGNKVYIIKAYPPENAEIINTLNFNATVRGLFINKERLVIITSTTSYVRIMIEKNKTISIPKIPYQIINTTILIYDTSNIVKPILINSINATGSYVTSRMINNYVYVIVQQYISSDIIILPEINGIQVKPTQIKYIVGESGHQFTTIIAINISNREYRSEVYLLEASSYIYVSPRNLYILIPKWLKPEEILDKLVEAILPILPSKIGKKVTDIMKSNLEIREKYVKIMNTISEWFNNLSSKEREKYTQKLMQAIAEVISSHWHESTAIYKFSLDKLEVKLTAQSTIPGRVLDQFSMDEYNNHFRIATTTSKSEVINGQITRLVTSNAIYILNEKLEIIGKIEDIAVEERIYAARYLGNIMFLVTFRRIDPLFGIDLSNPTEPKIIGYLKIPGYAEYLHPYKDKYLIGIGMHTDEEGRVKGIKISLFDISNPEDIKEKSKITMEGRFWSSLFSDHKAFMINEEKQYFTFPIEGEKRGVVVIEIKNGELQLKGIIEHENAQRTVYIENYIYTTSPNQIKILTENLTPIKTIKLNEK